MAASTFADFDNNSAVVGTNKIYAAVMHFGAEKGEFGSDKHGRPIPWGDIPARPFMELSTEDADEIMDTIMNFLRS